jgi:hypothetical protein
MNYLRTARGISAIVCGSLSFARTLPTLVLRIQTWYACEGGDLQAVNYWAVRYALVEEIVRIGYNYSKISHSDCKGGQEWVVRHDLVWKPQASGP